MNCRTLHINHIKFGENRSNGMGTKGKKSVWPLTSGWPWPQGHAQQRSQNVILCFTYVLDQVWWKSVAWLRHNSPKTSMTFDLEMTLTSRSCTTKVTECHAMLFICTSANLVKIGWMVKAQLPKNAYDLWPWGDLDLKVKYEMAIV